jgi:hypothetical protein
MTTQKKHLAGDRVLSVREAVEYIDSHFWAREHSSRRHFMSESTVRRYLRDGRHESTWTCTRTTDGHLGITVRDLRKRFATVKVKLTKAQRAASQAWQERFQRKYQKFLLGDEGQAWLAGDEHEAGPERRARVGAEGYQVERAAA